MCFSLHFFSPAIYGSICSAYSHLQSIMDALAEENRMKEELEREQWLANEIKRRQDRQIKTAQAEMDAIRRDAMEKQRLLGTLEWSLVALLDRLGLRDELSFPLANANLTSLKDLLRFNEQELAKALDLGGSGLDLSALVSQATLSSRREYAIAALNSLHLDEDKDPQQSESANSSPGPPSPPKPQRELAPGLAALISAQSPDEMSPSEQSPQQPFDTSPQHSFTASPPQKMTATGQSEEMVPARARDGPLRRKLFVVAERWHDYLATVPSFGSALAADSLATPSWKDTVAWALWMLTSRAYGMKHGGPSGWISKETIEGYLTLARDHVWRALFPSLHQLDAGEWRLYWARVFRNFEGFFSDKGRERWTQLAATEARAEAVRSGLTIDQQETAASKAVLVVREMLRRRQPEMKRDRLSANRLTQRSHTSRERTPELKRSSSLPESPKQPHEELVVGGRLVPRIPSTSSTSMAQVRMLASARTPARSRGSASPKSRDQDTLSPREDKSSPQQSVLGTSSAKVRDRELGLGSIPDTGEHAMEQSPRTAFANAEERRRRAAEEVIQRETSKAVLRANGTDHDELTRERATEMIAAEAAANHKGRRGSIAAAAATAIALVRQQQQVKERRQRQALEARYEPGFQAHQHRGRCGGHVGSTRRESRATKDAMLAMRASMPSQQPRRMSRTTKGPAPESVTAVRGSHGRRRSTNPFG
jgi:hypothetical protein